MKPGDVVVGLLPGAIETKVRPAIVIASATYLVERADVLVGILTTRLPRPLTSTDCILIDWRLAGLRAESCFRAYVLTMHRSELTVIGHLSEQDWNQVKACVALHSQPEVNCCDLTQYSPLSREMPIDATPQAAAVDGAGARRGALPRLVYPQIIAAVAQPSSFPR